MLINYVNLLMVGGLIVGYFGVVWIWYLVVEDWEVVFDGDVVFLEYIELDFVKVVILMIDGSFNVEIFLGQGSLDVQVCVLCDLMKVKDVKVYVVVLNVLIVGKVVLFYCVFGLDYYFEFEIVVEFIEVYQKIVMLILDLWIFKQEVVKV